MQHSKQNFVSLYFFYIKTKYTASRGKRIIFYLVNLFVYSLHLVSLHPQSRDVENELLILQPQVVVDALQKTVHAG